VMQLSILGQVRTAQIVERGGLIAQVADFSFFPFSPIFQQNGEQIRRVEQLSDAYHYTLGGDEMMVAYLVEIRRRDA